MWFRFHVCQRWSPVVSLMLALLCNNSEEIKTAWKRYVNGLEKKKAFIMELESDAGKKLWGDSISVPKIQQLLSLRERRGRMTRWLLYWLTGRVRLRENIGGWRVGECERLINLYCSQNGLSSGMESWVSIWRAQCKGCNARLIHDLQWKLIITNMQIVNA